MDAWRMLQGLKDENETEYLINQGMSQKLREEGNYSTQYYGEN